MRMWSRTALAVTALVVAAGLLTAAGGKKDAGQSALKKLQGTWKGVSWKQDNREVAPERARTRAIILEGDQYTAVAGDEIVEEGTVKIDPTRKPATIDATVTGGKYKGKTWHGIYKLAGDDKLIVCFAGAGKDRPSKFSVKAPEGGHTLVVYERAKSK